MPGTLNASKEGPEQQAKMAERCEPGSLNQGDNLQRQPPYLRMRTGRRAGVPGRSALSSPSM